MILDLDLDFDTYFPCRECLPIPERRNVNVDAVLRLLGVFHDVLYGDNSRTVSETLFLD